MAVLSAELVQRLARRGLSDQPVVTLYLNVDGRENIRPEDYCHHLDAMVRDALAKERPKSVVDDLQRITDYVNNEFERGNTRGLAIFACGDDLWDVVPLPVAVQDHLVVNMTPHVRRLETILDEFAGTGVLLTDRQRARLLIIEFGRIVEREEVIDPLPRHDDDKGDWGKDHVKTHTTVQAAHHFRHAANAMFDLYQRHRFSHLVLCAVEESRGEIERQLHDYLSQKIVGWCSLPIGANDEEIVSTALKMVNAAERAKEREFVEKLRAGVHSTEAAGRTNGDSASAVAGLEPTLNAVFQKRVDTLLVSEGYAAEGWRCTQCTYIATVGRKCRMCGSTMTLVEDVVEEAVEDALGQSCRVEFCTESADLDVMGRIGALLRY